MPDCVHFVPFTHYDWTFRHVGPLQWNPTAFCIIAAFCGVALWMCIELFVQVFFTFKRHRGLYFWSIVITTWGLSLQVTGYLLKNFSHSAPKILVTIICKIGWVSNVTGFSLVLYSRLHLVVHNPKILRVVLAMIITDAILFHTPVVVFEFGLISRHHDTYVRPMEIMERIQQTGFTIQESIISGLYIWHTTNFLKGTYSKETRKVMALLIAVQSLVIGLDAGLTTFDYMNMFTLKCTIHPFVYSVKLKLEFVVLNQLLNLVKHGLAPSNFPRPDDDESGISAKKDRSPSPSSEGTSPAIANKTKRPWTWRLTSSRSAFLPASAGNSRQITKTQEFDITVDAAHRKHSQQSNLAPAIYNHSKTEIEPAPRKGLALEPVDTLEEVEKKYLGRFGNQNGNRLSV